MQTLLGQNAPVDVGYVLDRIVAEVEDQVILQSDIENAILDIQRQKVELPENAQCFIISQSIINKILAAQAKRDSIELSNEEIDNEIDLRIRRFIQLYGSLESLEEVAGRTVFQIKEDFREAIRESKLAERMQQALISDITLTPQEVRNYFHLIPNDSLPYYESEIEVGVLSIQPKPSPDLNEFLRKELEEYRRQVLTGKISFDFIVKTYSQDPGKAQNNGVYQISLQDNFWDPNFLSACFRLEDGEISHPVKSKFGYHIIQMLERRGTEASVRHVLRMSQPSENEKEETKKTLENIRKKILNAKISFSDAVNLYGEDTYARFSGGMIVGPDGNTTIPYDQLDPPTLEIVQKLDPGEISDPSEYQMEQGQLGYRIILLKSRTIPHQENLEYDFNKVSTRLLIKRKREILEEWTEKIMQNVNLFVDPAYHHCDAIKRWIRVKK